MCDFHQAYKDNTLLTNLSPHLRELRPNNDKNSTTQRPEKGTYLCPEVPQRTLNIYNHLLKEGLL